MVLWWSVARRSWCLHHNDVVPQYNMHSGVREWRHVRLIFRWWYGTTHTRTQWWNAPTTIRNVLATCHCVRGMTEYLVGLWSHTHMMRKELVTIGYQGIIGTFTTLFRTLRMFTKTSHLVWLDWRVYGWCAMTSSSWMMTSFMEDPYTPMTSACNLLCHLDYGGCHELVFISLY